MLNLFGAIANGIGRMLPGYINGYRMAIQDNWNDLNQYNKVQEGQIGNAWLETSFKPMYNQLLLDTYMRQAAARGAQMQDTLNQAAFPGEFAKTLQNSRMAPDINYLRQQDTINNYGHNAYMQGLERWLSSIMLPQIQQSAQPQQVQPQQVPQFAPSITTQSAEAFARGYR